MPSYSAEELRKAGEAIAAWARCSYGFMGRTPDYKAAFLASLGADPGYYEPYADNARRWYRECARRVLFVNHVLVNPPVDRARPVHEVEDVYLIFELVLGGSPLMVPSSRDDLREPELRRFVDRFYRGSETSGVERVKLFKLIWDAIGTEFGGRQELYERNFAGNHEQIRLDLAALATRSGLADQATDLVRACMNEYDIDG